MVVGAVLGLLFLSAFAAGWWCGADSERDRAWGLLFDRGREVGDEAWLALRSVRNDVLPVSWLGIRWGGRWTS